MGVRVLFVCLLVVLWAFVSWDWPKCFFLQSDTFWLIETGRYILERQGLPPYDVYSLTRHGSTWIVYQWLFEVALSGLFTVGGWLLVSLSAGLLLAWLFFVDMPRLAVGAKANALIVISVIVLAIVGSLPDIVAVRPQLVSFVLLWLTYKVLNRNWPSPDRTLWMLVPIMLLWANVHISFVVQLAVLAIYMLVEGAALFRLRADTSAPVARNQTQPGRLSVSFLVKVSTVCLVASLLNPYGIQIYQFIIHSWMDQNITPELRPVDWGHAVPLLAYIVVACISLVLAWRRLSLPQLIAAAMLLVAGLFGARFILYFVVWSVPIVCQALTKIADPVLEREDMLISVNERVRRAVMEPVYPFIVLLAVGCITIARPTFFPAIIPVEAAKQLTKTPPAGALFCGEHAGSYLIYLFRGLIPVFVDTRADVYGREFCDGFRRIMLTGQGWSETADRFQIETALVPLRYQLAKDLLQSRDWQLVYKDQTYAIFKRSQSPK